MIVLDPTLLAAQNSLERQPIVKMRSSTYLPEIPFDGSIFNPNFSGNESVPFMIRLSDNSLAVVYVATGGEIRFMRSDSEKLQFSQPVSLPGVLGSYLPSMVELPSGDIGVILVDLPAGVIRRMVISTTGAVVTPVANIQDWSDNYTISGSAVARLSDGTYRAAIGILNETTGVWKIGLYSSANFLTWSAISLLDLPGLADDREKFNPCLFEASTGMLVLAFEYATYKNDDGQITLNVYTFLSADKGVTWSPGTQVTNYDDLIYDAKYPTIAEKSDGSILLSYTEEATVRFIDENSTGYLEASGGDVIGACMSPTDIHYDPAMGLLHVMSSANATGVKTLFGIYTIDVATWTIQKSVTNHTVPAFSDIYTDDSAPIWWDTWKSDGKYTCFGIKNGFHFGVYNSESDTITQYNFKESVEYGLDANINGGVVMTSACGTGYECSVRAAQIVADDHRLYLMLISNYFWCRECVVGYIDLTEPPDPITGEYTFTEIFRIGGVDLQNVFSLFCPSHFLVVPEADYLFVSEHNGFDEYNGGLWIAQLSTGQTIATMTYLTHSSFHKNGMRNLLYANGHLYGSFDYDADHGQGDRRGLMDLNIASLSVSYHRPTYASLDDYSLLGKTAMGDGRILIATDSAYGAVIFNPEDETWAHFNEDTVPGIGGGASLGFETIAYDATNHIIFGGSYALSDGKHVAAFNESGAFQQSKYYDGDPVEGDAYSFDSEASNLTLYSYDSDAAVVYDEADSLWAVWTNRKIAKTSIMWDSETQSPDLTDRLVSGTSIDITWDITAPNKLTLTLADGHLFDPQNSLSTLSNAVRKGRVIEIEFGETIGGVPYWQPQGKFLVTENRVSYVKGSAPTISVTAEDQRTVWDHMTIAATEDYSSAMPSDILIDLLQEHCGLTADGYDVQPFVNEHECFIQWIDQNFAEIVKGLCDHFGYFPAVTVEDKVTFRRIDLTRSATDNTYPASAIIEFTPEDSYSNFTNRVIVNGESHETIEVLYEAEAIKAISGTLGWWGGENKVRVWYSEDKSRTCLNPRLEIHQSVKDYGPFMGLFDGYGSEGIVGEDDLHQWCEVKTEMPSLIAYVLGEIAALMATASLAMSCDTSRNCGLYIMMTQATASALFGTLASVAMYDYTVWANPVGHEKQQISAKADDVEKQTEMNGRIVSETIDDPLCYEIGQCAMVAAYELGIAKAQRNTIKVVKTAHLQDEVGDIVRLLHPYTSQPLRGFIVGLTRSYMKPDSPDGDGYFTDSVNMWRL